MLLLRPGRIKYCESDPLISWDSAKVSSLSWPTRWSRVCHVPSWTTMVFMIRATIRPATVHQQHRHHPPIRYWPIHPPSVRDAVMAYSVICDRPLNDVMFLPWSKMPYAVMNYNFLAYNHIMLIV